MSTQGHKPTLRCPSSDFILWKLSVVLRSPRVPSTPEIDSPEGNETADATDQEKSNDNLAADWPKRTAALQARDKIIVWTTHENEHD